MLRSLAMSLAGVTAGSLLQAGSCITVVNPTPDPGGGDPDSVTVRFVNQSAYALDPQFYATGNVLGDPEQILFIPGNQITSGFGFAGRGTLEVGESDELEFDCAAARTIGTRGGVFLNRDTGGVVGTGQQRFSGIEQTYNCGSVVSLIYSGSTASGFTTSFLVD